MKGLFPGRYLTIHFNEDTKNMGTIGTRLKTWRIIKGLRLSDVTELVDVAQGKLSDLENNNALPSAQTLINFAECTDVDIHWFLMGKSYKWK